MLDTPPNARTPFCFIHEEPPAAGQTMELFEGLHWARFPLPSRLGHVNIWLLEGDDGWTIIDTGMNNAATAEVWESLFAGLLSTRPIALIIVTHSHSDHIGHLQHLHKRAPSAPVVMTLNEYFVCLMRLYEPNDRLVEQGALTMSLCGPPPEVIEKMVSIRTGVRGAFSGLPLQYTRIAAGDTIRAGNRKPRGLHLWRPFI